MIKPSASEKAKANFKAAIQAYMQREDVSPREAEKVVWPLIEEAEKIHKIVTGRSWIKLTKQESYRLIDEIFDELNEHPV